MYYNIIIKTDFVISYLYYYVYSNPNLQTGDLNQDAQLKEVVSVQCPPRVPNEAITPVSLDLGCSTENINNTLYNLYIVTLYACVQYLHCNQSLATALTLEVQCLIVDGPPPTLPLSGRPCHPELTSERISV